MQRITASQEQIVDILKGYTTRVFVEDEIRRSLELLTSIYEDAERFCGVVPRGAGFLPRNQLLYSLVYMALVPGRFASRMFVRAPLAARTYTAKLLELLEGSDPDRRVSLVSSDYMEFISQNVRGADFVIFTGSSATARKVNNALTGSELFLGSGHGHNPVIVLDDVDVASAASKIVHLCLYNQGQDCSAPSAILCSHDLKQPLALALAAELAQIDAKDATLPLWNRTVGPNNDLRHAQKVGELLANQRERILYQGWSETEGVVPPTIIHRPLRELPSYLEWFAPVISLQSWDRTEQLNGYFATGTYRKNAMYVTLLGSGQLDLPDVQANHPVDTILQNTDLHEHERGYRPYGGYGPDASYIALGRIRVSGPILAQSDLVKYLLEPRLSDMQKRVPISTKHSSTMSSVPAHIPPRSDERQGRISKLKQLVALGVDPYPAKSNRADTCADVQARFKDLPVGEETEEIVSVAGRVMAIRNSGMFIDIFDASEHLQLFVELKSASEDITVLLKNLDIGDFIQATGRIRRTKRGELTANVSTMTIISKALVPPPEKFHGMVDVEQRYRKRSADLIANQASRDRLKARFRLVAGIRALLTERGFMEVETPMLQPIYGGANARPFSTHHNALDVDLFLRIAPELYLKRLLIGGLSDKLFELNRNFRNEGLSVRHNPEFTMLEAYQAYADVNDMRELVEAIVRHAVLAASGGNLIGPRQDIDITQPFHTLSMIDEASRVIGDDVRLMDHAKLSQAAVAVLSEDTPPADTWGEIIEQIFEQKVEQNLWFPTHMVDFPADISPLAKRSPQDPRIAERFETYCAGMEIANAFSEMNDPILQQEVLEEQVRAAVANGDFDKSLDHDFLYALELGMPPSGGLGIGIDRLAMLATGASTIREVLAFPLMRPLTGSE